MEAKFRTVDLNRIGSVTEKFYLFNFLLIMRKQTVNYLSKGSHLKQSDSVYFLFGFLPVYGKMNLNNKL